MRGIRVASTFLLLVVAPLAVADTVTFERIPGTWSIMDMTPDGRFVVGQTDRDGDGFPDGTYRLNTVTGDMLYLPPEGLTAAAVSDDGSVVLGDIPDPNDPDPTMGTVAGIWTEETGWRSLGYLPDALECPSRSDGYELSADGGIAVGLSWDGCNGRGFVWTEVTGMQELDPFFQGGCRASVVSADGTVVGGFAQGMYSRTPVVWDGITLEGEMLGPPDGSAEGEVRGINDDGTILLGTMYLSDSTYFVYDAVMWTQGSSGWEVERVGGGSHSPTSAGNAMDIADDGTIVGFDNGRTAWILPAGSDQIVSMRSYIESLGGTVPAGQNLDVARVITPDGRVIAGLSWLPMVGGWLVRIEPDPVPGDINGDGRVDLQDLALLLAAYDTCDGDPFYDADADLDDSGCVDLSDLAILLANYDTGG